MSPEAQRTAIAEVRGFSNFQNKTLREGEGEFAYSWEVLHGDTPQFKDIAVPDYPGDLNAMHDAETGLTQQQQRDYAARLHYEMQMTNKRHPMDHLGVDFDVMHATAAQRAEALLRILDKWEGQ